MAKESKKFPLRLMDKKTYPALQKLADARYTSVNSLINSILEESLKKGKKDLLVSK